VYGGIHQNGSGKASAIAAAQEKGPFVCREEKPAGGERRRCFAAAADSEIAKANHRHAGAAPVRL
jgi:hypothetical protein